MKAGPAHRPPQYGASEEPDPTRLRVLRSQRGTSPAAIYRCQQVPRVLAIPAHRRTGVRFSPFSGLLLRDPRYGRLLGVRAELNGDALTTNQA